MFQVFVLRPEDDLSSGSKLVAIQIKLFTSKFAVIMNIYRFCICYAKGDVSYIIYGYNIAPFQSPHTTNIWGQIPKYTP
jgi:hypothetical protein